MGYSFIYLLMVSVRGVCFTNILFLFYFEEWMNM